MVMIVETSAFSLIVKILFFLFLIYYYNLNVTRPPMVDVICIVSMLLA